MQRLVIFQALVPGGHTKGQLQNLGLKLVANQYRITGIVKNGSQALSELVFFSTSRSRSNPASEVMWPLEESASI